MHVARSDWPRWMFAKGGKAGMSEADLDAIGAPQVRQRQSLTPPEVVDRLAGRIDEMITAPVSLMCDCGWTTPFGSKNHGAALRMHQSHAKIHKAVPVEA